MDSNQKPPKLNFESFASSEEPFSVSLKLEEDEEMADTDPKVEAPKLNFEAFSDEPFSVSLQLDGSETAFSDGFAFSSDQSNAFQATTTKQKRSPKRSPKNKK